jgi:hypothetical protein
VALDRGTADLYWIALIFARTNFNRKKSSGLRSIQNDRATCGGVSSFHACESISPARAPVSVIEGRKSDENECD